jgi:hypothetical protein
VRVYVCVCVRGREREMAKYDEVVTPKPWTRPISQATVNFMKPPMKKKKTSRFFKKLNILKTIETDGQTDRRTDRQTDGQMVF